MAERMPRHPGASSLRFVKEGACMMSTMEPISRTAVVPSRRQFLRRVSTVTLSASALALLVGREAIAAGKGKPMAANPAQDVSILNVALGLEHEAIGAYQLGAESGLLQKPVLDVAVLFQSHHKQHRDALIAAIKQMGGTPVAAKPLNDYAMALNASTLKSQTDVLNLAGKL